MFSVKFNTLDHSLTYLSIITTLISPKKLKGMSSNIQISTLKSNNFHQHYLTSKKRLNNSLQKITHYQEKIDNLKPQSNSMKIKSKRSLSKIKNSHFP